MPDSERIPTTLTREELFAALDPFLTLCGVDVREVVGDIHISPARITFAVLARITEEKGRTPFGVTAVDTLQPAPQDGELMWPVTIDLVDEKPVWQIAEAVR